MKKRQLSVSYVLFYLLFWPDTYRILFGICGSVWLTPLILRPPVDLFSSAMVHTMLACIGYAITARPAGHIAAFLRKRILKNHRT